MPTLEEHAAKRKALRKRQDKRKKDGVHTTGNKLLPVMTKAEQARRLHELKAEMLTHKNVGKFIEKIFDVAMDDDHNGQTAAMKLIADRILPTSGFASEDKRSTGVQINITGLQIEKVEEKEVSQPVSIQ